MIKSEGGALATIMRDMSITENFKMIECSSVDLKWCVAWGVSLEKDGHCLRLMSHSAPCHIPLCLLCSSQSRTTTWFKATNSSVFCVRNPPLPVFQSNIKVLKRCSPQRHSPSKNTAVVWTVSTGHISWNLQLNKVSSGFKSRHKFPIWCLKFEKRSF